MNNVVELQKLSRHCGYSTDLNDKLCDTFVAGLRDPQIKQKLLSKKDLDWKTAEEIAISMESAKRDTEHAAERTAVTGDVNEVSRQGQRWQNSGGSNGGKGDRRGRKSLQQLRCGRYLGDHTPDWKAKCYECQHVGHISKACRSASKSGGKQKSHKTHHVSVDSEPDDMDSVADDLNEFSLYALYGVNAAGSNKEFWTTVYVEGCPTAFTIDTGAAVSVISEAAYKSYFAHVKLQTSTAVLHSYSGDIIPLLGKITVQFEYDGQKHPTLDSGQRLEGGAFGKELDGQVTA